MQLSKPIIAIVSCHKMIDGQPSQSVYQKYIDAVQHYGGNAILLPNTAADDKNFDALMTMVDGILLTGSYSNVAPDRYGATHIEEKQDLGRDELSFKLLAYADKNDVPLFAVCRGHQEMNVYFEGTLYPDWREVEGFYEPHLEDSTQPLEVQYQPVHDVLMQPGGRLATFGDKWHVNSLHKQAIHEVGTRLFVEAIAPDGMIEAISLLEHPFMIGVQWHPELNYAQDNLSKFLFTEFIDYARKKPLNHQYKSNKDNNDINNEVKDKVTDQHAVDIDDIAEDDDKGDTSTSESGQVSVDTDTEAMNDLDKPTNELKEEDIGKKVNQLRLAKGYSQRKLARMAGLTNTSISSIERNKVSPAVNTLKAILEVLGSDLTTFFSDEWQEPKARVVVTPKDLLEISEPGCRVSLKQVYNHSTTKNLGFLIETYQPNSSTEEKIAHEGEEIGTVIEGKILIRIDETTYLLNQGDSYVIDTNRPHTFMNPSDSIARVISAHTPTTY